MPKVVFPVRFWKAPRRLARTAKQANSIGLTANAQSQGTEAQILYPSWTLWTMDVVRTVSQAKKRVQHQKRKTTGNAPKMRRRNFVRDTPLCLKKVPLPAGTTFHVRFADVDVPCSC